MIRSVNISNNYRGLRPFSKKGYTVGSEPRSSESRACVMAYPLVIFLTE